MARSKTGSRSSRTKVRGKPITRPARPKLTSLTTSTALKSNKAVVGIHKSGVTTRVVIVRAKAKFAKPGRFMRLRAWFATSDWMTRWTKKK